MNGPELPDPHHDPSRLQGRYYPKRDLPRLQGRHYPKKDPPRLQGRHYPKRDTSLGQRVVRTRVPWTSNPSKLRTGPLTPIGVFYSDSKFGTYKFGNPCSETEGPRTKRVDPPPTMISLGPRHPRPPSPSGSGAGPGSFVENGPKSSTVSTYQFDRKSTVSRPLCLPGVSGPRVQVWDTSYHVSTLGRHSHPNPFPGLPTVPPGTKGTFLTTSTPELEGKGRKERNYEPSPRT